MSKKIKITSKEGVVIITTQAFAEATGTTVGEVETSLDELEENGYIKVEEVK